MAYLAVWDRKLETKHGFVSGVIRVLFEELVKLSHILQTWLLPHRITYNNTDIRYSNDIRLDDRGQCNPISCKESFQCGWFLYVGCILNKIKHSGRI